MLSYESVRVLLIEDQPGEVRLVQEMLKENRAVSCELSTAARLKAGLELLTAASIDVILLDLSLPDSKGLETFIQVQAHAPQIPVIVLTGLDDETIALEALKKGAQDYLIKGQVDSRLLWRAIHYTLGRRQAARALQESEERYRALFEQAGDAILLTDAAQQIIDANPYACELFGYSRSEFLSMKLADLYAPETRPMWLHALALNLGAPTPFETVNVHRSGAHIPVEVTTALMPGANNALLIIARDIRARKQAEAVLRRRNQELALLNRVITTAAATLEIKEILYVACDELARFFGIPQASALLLHEAPATTSNNENKAPEITVTRVVEYLDSGYPGSEVAALTLAEAPILYEVVTHKKPIAIYNGSGDTRIGALDTLIGHCCAGALLLLPLVVRDRVSSIIALIDVEPRVFTAGDITVAQGAVTAAGQTLEVATLYQTLQQHAESLEDAIAQRTAELKTAMELAQAGNRAKSQFVSNVSHELRTPLTSIKTYLYLLEHNETEKRAEYIDILYREATRLQDLIENLLDLSRLDLEQIEPVARCTDVNTLIDKLVRDRETLFTAKGLDLHLQVTKELPPVKVDPTLLEQALSNLLSNALTYTPSGGKVWLNTNLAEAEDQSWLKISVRDTGPGISPEEQSCLFTRFYRGQASVINNNPGTGLGLAISKAIVHLHRGRITLESQEKQGSTFTVWLPTALMCDKAATDCY